MVMAGVGVRAGWPGHGAGKNDPVSAGLRGGGAHPHSWQAAGCYRAVAALDRHHVVQDPGGRRGPPGPAAAAQGETAMIDQHFGILAALLPLAGFASYIRDTLKGKTQPNRTSWSLWAVAPLIAFGAELAQHASLDVASLGFTLGFGPLLVVAASFTDRKSYWKLTRLDLLCGSISIVALTLWAITGQGNLAIFFSILADLFAAVPTIAKSYRHPRSESAGTYLATAAAAGITLLAIPHWTFTMYGFPLYVMVVCSIIIALIALPQPRKVVANGYSRDGRPDFGACLETSCREQH